MIKPHFFLFAAAVVVANLLAGCAQKGCTDPLALNYNQQAQRDDRSCTYGDKYEDTKIEIAENYANLSFAMHSDAFESVVMLQLMVEEFIAAPTASRFDKCKLAWQDAHAAYVLCEVYRFPGSPAEDDRQLAQLIDAWPIEPSYIDYTQFNDSSGIINNAEAYPKINATVLRAAQLNGSVRNVSLGFHAIEFLLWGEDTAAASEKTAGSRPYTDYASAEATAPNAQRRGEYLSAAASLLASSLSELTNEWGPSVKNNYRSDFLKLTPNGALKNIMNGMAILANEELAIKNLLIPIELNNTLLEQSVFSDHTTFDIKAMVASLEYIYEGEFTKLDGTVVAGSSIKELLADASVESALEVEKNLDDVVAFSNEIPVPFDHQTTLELPGTTGPIASTIDALKALSGSLQNAGTDLGVSVKTER